MRETISLIIAALITFLPTFPADQGSAKKNLSITVGAAGTTYCVDFAGGSDAATGIPATNCHSANNHAWKHIPGMLGCSGVCASTSPAAGNQFILKGGVTWNHTNFQINWQWSGTAGNRIYIGVDTLWYAGGSFTQPIWDAELLVDGILTTNTSSHLQIDNIEMKRSLVTSDTGGSSTLLIDGTVSGDILMTNLKVHYWQRCLGAGNPTATCTAAVADNLGSNGGIYNHIVAPAVMTGVILDHSDVGSPENTDGGKFGACGFGIEQLTFNNIHDCTEGNIHGGRVIHDNVLNNVGATFPGDTGATHGNNFYSDQYNSGGAGAARYVVYIYNNKITNVGADASSTVIYPNPGTSGATSSVEYWIWNNVVYGGVQIANDTDNTNAPSSFTMDIHDWNNTYVVSSTGTCVRNVDHPPRNSIVRIFDVQNLHCISVGGTGTTVDTGNATAPSTNNIVGMSDTTATSQGYTVSNDYAPTLGTNSTVGAGANLAANCSGNLVSLCRDTTLGNTRSTNARPSTWDAGAFQWQ